MNLRLPCATVFRVRWLVVILVLGLGALTERPQAQVPQPRTAASGVETLQIRPNVYMLAGDYEISAGTFRVDRDGHITVSLACGGRPDVYDSIEVRRGGEPVLSAQLPV